MITISAIDKRFRSLHVLHAVSASIPSGTVTAVIGPNGSGKTTLMKCIMGLVRPDTGNIVVNGVTAIDNPACREAIGYMSQVARYPDNLSPKELIEMVRGVRRGQGDSADDIIRVLQLEQHMTKPMRTLSGGTRQKVGAVLAFMFEPSTVLLDEPTAGLDPRSSERLKERVLASRTAGATILISSHVLAEVQEVADRIMYVHEGRIAYEGTLQDLLDTTGQTSLGKAIAGVMDAVEARS